MDQVLSTRPPGTPQLRLGCVALGWVIVLITGGCQSYERQPLDIAGHQAAFLARTPESPEVRSFAASLASQVPVAAEFEPADGISCEEAEVIALIFNAELRLARLRAGVTRATAENAGLWEDPTIGVDLTRIIESTPEPWKVFASVGITIPISGRLEIEKQRAGIEHAAELTRVAQSEWSVRMSVRRAWSEWSALDAQLASTRDFLARVDQILSVVDKMEQAGEMARTESRLFRIEKATRFAELLALESRAAQVDLLLRQLMGMSPDAPLRFQANGVGPAGAEAAQGAGAVSEADAAALQTRSPALLVALAEYETAEKTLELEVRRQYPDLQIGPGYGREDGQNQVLLGLSLPIPILNANRQGIAVARAERELARANAEATMEQVIASLRALEARRTAAVRRRQSLESDLVPLVDAQYTEARAVARLGEVNTLILLESLARQQDAKVSLIEARLDEALAGIEVAGVLGPPPAPASTASGPDPTSPTPASADPSSLAPPTPPASGGSRR